MARFVSGVSSVFSVAIMCTHSTQLFHKHELLQPYRYYWRIQFVVLLAISLHPADVIFRPGGKYFCNLYNDPFAFMQENNKTYGLSLW